MKSKYRHEIKFVISPEAATILKQRLDLLMTIDKNYATDDYRYYIRSLYFDTVDSDSYFEKIDGVLFRKKYRLRYYNQDPSFIILECKHKHDNMSLKEKIRIDHSTAVALANNESIDVNYEQGNLLHRFLLERIHAALIPSTIVDYYRLAYVYEPLNVRITFDDAMTSGNFSTDFFAKDYAGVPILKTNEVIMEMKFDEVIPEYIFKTVASIPSVRQAISKFVICRGLK